MTAPAARFATARGSGTFIALSQGRMDRMLRTILCPVDFERNSLQALELARRIASRVDAALYVLHVCPTVSVPLGGVVTNPVLADQLAEAKLNEIAGRRLGGVRHHLMIRHGDAGRAVVDAARELGANLVVMGTHGRSGLPRLLLGSVAEHALREAPCPVLTTREE